MDYMTREAIDVLPMVLDASGFQEGILLGHSDGATIAAIYAGTVKDLRVSGWFDCPAFLCRGYGACINC